MPSIERATCHQCRYGWRTKPENKLVGCVAPRPDKFKNPGDITAAECTKFRPYGSMTVGQSVTLARGQTHTKEIRFLVSVCPSDLVTFYSTGEELFSTDGDRCHIYKHQDVLFPKGHYGVEPLQSGKLKVTMSGRNAQEEPSGLDQALAYDPFDIEHTFGLWGISRCLAEVNRARTEGHIDIDHFKAVMGHDLFTGFVFVGDKLILKSATILATITESPEGLEEIII